MKTINGSNNVEILQKQSWMIFATAILTVFATSIPLLFTFGDINDPYVVENHLHTSVRGEVVHIYGHGPYRHMPRFIAVQGLAHDLVTLMVGVPSLLISYFLARDGSTVGYFLLTGVIMYLFAQYFLFLGMGTYSELFLVYVALLFLTSQMLARLLIFGGTKLELQVLPSKGNIAVARKMFVGMFLLVNGLLIILLWLSVIVPPLISGTLYPIELAHLTTMVVQGYDLAILLPPSLSAGYSYLKGTDRLGAVLAPSYSIFLSYQMTALIAKLVWMHMIGVNGGPALVIIPMLFAGALTSSIFALSPHRTSSLCFTISKDQKAV